MHTIFFWLLSPDPADVLTEAAQQATVTKAFLLTLIALPSVEQGGGKKKNSFGVEPLSVDCIVMYILTPRGFV